MNVYKTCPVLQNDNFILRLVNDGDLNDLFKIYSDIKAVPLFNSDNCHGDDFYYTTIERMKQALDFWKQAYENGWFVRFAVEDKNTNEVIGTIEQFHRDEKDYFTNCGLLRLDLRSDYEEADKIQSIVSLIAEPSFELFGCDKVATKAIPSAKERIKALTALGFKKSDEPLIGHDGIKYFDYFVLNKQKSAVWS
ncbi:MAG: N-acetyltransferase [Clostridia bacterium]|nr:N-acetyltransferase [Clostridia bacterium]